MGNCVVVLRGMMCGDVEFWSFLEFLCESFIFGLTSGDE